MTLTRMMIWKMLLGLSMLDQEGSGAATVREGGGKMTTIAISTCKHAKMASKSCAAGFI